jgi:hypothetical protein
VVSATGGWVCKETDIGLVHLTTTNDPLSTPPHTLTTLPLLILLAKTMSGYKSFAIWGAGHMGRPVIDAFLALKASGLDITVVVLTREVAYITSVVCSTPDL